MRSEKSIRETELHASNAEDWFFVDGSELEFNRRIGLGGPSKSRVVDEGLAVVGSGRHDTADREAQGLDDRRLARAVLSEDQCHWLEEVDDLDPVCAV